ncbi:PPOX class F420-dependent oxidoreductase [Nocardia abscessus]|uniref:PPOX class F420-dependent oxidoreductase n=1 Tax=Nocardia abscessus TaxID=120957 RepID=UPI001894263A|nr:PPOX class F420-dependent oxidoreductase [Nocardia abscessus]MBF6340024.1 PPOX class F420-dependent oxidoreductase [Nocardia abscessus]
MPLDDTVRTLIDGPHAAVLATANADGRPQSSVIFVDYDGDTLLFSTIEGRLKTRNMARDPRVSLLVLSRTDGRYVEVRGRVEITADPDKTLHAAMYAKYMGGATPPPEPEAHRLIVRIVPERVYVFPPA